MSGQNLDPYDASLHYRSIAQIPERDYGEAALRMKLPYDRTKVRKEIRRYQAESFGSAFKDLREP